MLVEIAIGDAYGAGFEFASPEFVEKYNHLTGYVAHPRFMDSRGCFTDDTQMSIAIAECVLNLKKWTPISVAEKFVHAFRRDQRGGYARGFYQLLQEVKDGHELIDRLRPNSEKSGAAMRAAPIGFFSNIQDVVDRSKLQAAITHNTPNGINSSLATSLATHYMIYRLGPKKSLFEFLREYIPEDWFEPFMGPVGIEGKDCVRAALTGTMVTDSLADLLKICVAYTGDVDTVAAIAMGIASPCSEMNHDLPQFLYDDLEHSPYGYDYLRTLDQRLLSLVR